MAEGRARDREGHVHLTPTIANQLSFKGQLGNALNATHHWFAVLPFLVTMRMPRMTGGRLLPRPITLRAPGRKPAVSVSVEH
jgi:hypothetical protein